MGRGQGQGAGRGGGRGGGRGPGLMGGSKAAGPGGNCICPNCGHQVQHQVGHPATTSGAPSAARRWRATSRARIRQGQHGIASCLGIHCHQHLSQPAEPGHCGGLGQPGRGSRDGPQPGGPGRFGGGAGRGQDLGAGEPGLSLRALQSGERGGGRRFDPHLLHGLRDRQEGAFWRRTGGDGQRLDAGRRGAVGDRAAGFQLSTKCGWAGNSTRPA